MKIAIGIAIDLPNEFSTGVLTSAKGILIGVAIDTDGKHLTLAMFNDASAPLHAGHEK